MARTTLGRQLHACRILLDVPRKEVAQILKRSVATVARAEGDDPSSRLMQRALRDFYSRNGAIFLTDGVQLGPRPDRPVPSAQAVSEPARRAA